jgi:dipeptidyl aminopeptidase/acylaminoacyl peptidase
MEGRAVASTERIVMKASDGVEIEAFLTRMPQSETNAKLPLLVLPHGGPFDVVDFQRFDPEVQFFAKLGFGVLQVNFRGSGGGKSKVELGYGKWGTTLISDIEVAVDAALQRFPLDADKVVAVGSSYGGYAALALARTNPERYKAVVGICGVYDLPLLFSAGLYSRREQGLENQKKILADPKTDMALLIDQSPAYDVEAIKAPVLLVHDRGDQIAPFEHAIRMSFVLNASGKRVDLLTTNDEVHGLVNEATAIAQYPKIAQFLRAALGSDRER